MAKKVRADFAIGCNINTALIVRGIIFEFMVKLGNKLSSIQPYIVRCFDLLKTKSCETVRQKNEIKIYNVEL